MDEREPVLDVVRRRWPVFQRLLEGPLYKRDLVASVDPSRSTVDRAVRELAEAGLVERVAGGYVATVAGRLAAEEYRAATDSLAAVGEAVAALEPLPYDAPLSGAVLTGATIHIAGEDATPAALADRFHERLADADTARVAVAGVADEEFAAAVAESAAGQVLVPPSADVDGRPASSPPPFTLLGTPTETVVLVHEGDGCPHALVEAASDAAAAWAADRFAELDPKRSPSTRGGSDRAVTAGAGPGDPASPSGAAVGATASPRLASEGFERLGDTQFDPAHARDLLTALRTGQSFADVAAGHALARERPAAPPAAPDDTDVPGESTAPDGSGDRSAESDGEGRDPARSRTSAGSEGDRERLDETLTASLADGDDVALVGPPGSGKSTVCRQVAHRWHEAGRGAVWYRQSGRGQRFAATGELAAALEREPGHALVVVEDAVRTGRAVFEVMRTFRDDPTVSILVDARTEEWGDPPGEPLAPDLRAFRDEHVAVARMPPLDERERDRFVAHVAEGLDRSVEELTAAVDAVAADDGDGDGGGSSPSAVLAFLHRLVTVAGVDGDAPSALRTDAAGTLERLREADAPAADLGVLANLLNAAGVAVEPAYLYALVAPPADADPAAIDAAVEALHGRVLFGPSPLEGRLPHEEWSVAFLDALLAAESAPAARRRVGRVCGALWSLADDPANREAVRDALGAEVAVLDRIAADPTAWADETTDQLFALAERRPGLVPLFGESDHALEPPAACSPAAVARAADRRCGARYDRGDYEVLAREAATLCRRADALRDPERSRFRSRALCHRAWAAVRTGAYDDGDRYAAWALALAEESGDAAETRKALGARGVAAWLDGDLDTAERHFRAAAARADPEGDPAGTASVQNNLGILHYERGDFDAAVERFERSRELRERAGAQLPLVDSLVNLGVIERDRGRPETAIERFRSAVGLAQEAGANDFLAHARRALGNTLADLGRAEEATAHLEAALALAREAGNRENVAHCLRGLGVAARARGAPDEAERYLTESRETAAAIDADRALALALRELGTLARERGDPETALDRLDECLGTFDPATRNAETARAHRERGEALLALGREPAAREAFTTARDHYRALGADALVAECERRLAVTD